MWQGYSRLVTEQGVTRQPVTVQVTAFDHLVLRCADVEATLAWYADRLGLEPIRVDEWRAGTVPFPSLRIDAGTLIDLVPWSPPATGRSDDPPGDRPTDGRLNHICLVVDRAGLEHVLADPSFTILDGPGERFGARGMATSVYVADPDGLVVELRAYPTSADPAGDGGRLQA